MSRTRRGWKIGGAAAVALLIAAQLVPVAERTNPPTRTVIEAPEEVAAVLRKACWNCHSNETDWPWYSRVAPSSWLVVGHVNDGRDDMNFTEWPASDADDARDLIEEIGEQVESGAMPPTSYRIMHPEARLSEEERQLLIDWSLAEGGLDRLDDELRRMEGAGSP